MKNGFFLLSLILLCRSLYSVGYIDVTSQPEGAAISIMEIKETNPKLTSGFISEKTGLLEQTPTYLGLTPHFSNELKEGYYRVFITLNNYKTEYKDIQVFRGKAARVNFKMTKGESLPIPVNPKNIGINEGSLFTVSIALFYNGIPVKVSENFLEISVMRGTNEVVVTPHTVLQGQTPDSFYASAEEAQYLIAELRGNWFVRFTMGSEEGYTAILTLIYDKKPLLQKTAGLPYESVSLFSHEARTAFLSPKP